MGRLAEQDTLPNATAPDAIAAMREALLSGKDVESAVYGGSSGSNDSNFEHHDDNPTVIEDSSYDTTPDTTASAAVDVSEPVSSKEVLWVKDETGKKVKIEVDYNDKESIKKAHLKALGMRKFQAERDSEKKARLEAEKKAAEKEGNWSELESAYKESGAKGVFERIGGAGAWDKAIADELAHREKLAGMSESERVVMDYDQRFKKSEAEKEQLRSTHQRMLEEISQKEAAAAERSLSSRLTPSFEKHRFHGKLGDEAAEHSLDKAVWGEVMERLSAYPDDVELSNALIDREFRAVAGTYSKVINKQVEAKTKEAINTQKANATERAQLVVKKNLTSNKIDNDVATDIKNNDWSSLLQKVLNHKSKR